MRAPLRISAALLVAILAACTSGGRESSDSMSTPTPAAITAAPTATTVATSPPSTEDVRGAAEAACAEAHPHESRNGCVDAYIELVDTGSDMSPAEAEAYGFPYRVCIWPDGAWTLSPRGMSGTLPVGSLGCGHDGKAKVTAIVEAP